MCTGICMCVWIRTCVCMCAGCAGVRVCMYAFIRACMHRCIFLFAIFILEANRTSVCSPSASSN